MNSVTWSSFRIACTVLVLALNSLISPAAADQNLELTFGLYATDKPTVLVKAFRPILTAIETDLSEALGVPVSIQTHISASYESGVAALVNGEVDFARFGPASYIAATEQNPGLRILALDSKDGEQITMGFICVREDSEFQQVADLKGARFAFGDEESTIGRYLSQAHLLEHGVSSRKLSHFAYLKRHDRVGHAVANGSFDAGAIKQGTYKKLIEKGLPLRILAQFGNINKPWIASSDMDFELFESLRDVMFSLSAPEAFEALGNRQFVPGKDSDFESIRNAIANNEDFFKPADSVNTASAEEQ